MKNNIKTLYNFIPVGPIQGFFFLIVVAISIGLLATPYYSYAIFPGLAILFLLFLGHYPEIGYYIIVFLIPFDAYRGLTDSYKFLTISKFVGFWIVIIILFYFLLKKRISFNIQSNLWQWFLILFVISLVSALVSYYPFTSFNNLRQLLVVYIFFAITLIFVSNKGFNRNLPMVLILSISISSFLSIIGYVFDIPLFAMNVESESVKRAIGAANNPNHFAATVIFILPLLSHWFFSSKRFLEKILAVILFIMNLTAIILTYSRGGAIVLSVILVLMFIEHMRRFKPKYLGFVTSLIAIVIITAVVLVPASYWERQKSVTDITDSSISRRTSYLYVGWEAFKKDPLIGSGPGTFIEIYAGSIYAPQYEDEGESYRRYAHNSYLEVLIGTGMLGFITFLAILLLTLRNFLIAKKNFLINGKEEMASLISAYQLSFISILTYFFLLSGIFHKFFWISIALSQIALRISQGMDKEEQDENTNRTE